MERTKFAPPPHWPPDACEFVQRLLAENQELRRALGLALADITELRAGLEKANAEIRELKSKLSTNSRNSSSPPSKDPPGTPSRDSQPTGRKPGAQKGHKGVGRSLLPPERVNERKDIFPEVCPHCHASLPKGDPETQPFRPFQQVDLPERVDVVVTEFRLFTCTCGECGQAVTAAMPPEAGSTVVGLRLKAFMGLLSSRYHLSKTLIQELLVDLFGPEAHFSRGCISEAEKEVAEALAHAHAEAKEHLQKAEAINVDETSWFLKHKLHWLWVAVTDALTVFSIDPNRSRGAFERFLGNFEGFIISDRFSAYRRLSPQERQLCWAHLKRDFQKLIDRQGGAESIGRWALREIEVMFGLWHWYLEGVMDEQELRKEFATIRARFRRLLQAGEETTDPKAAKFCKNLLEIWPALWNFLNRPDILQPTNNRAEQAIRPGVINRGLSLGSQAERGLRFVERMLTTVATLRRQGRHILGFLEGTLLAYRTGAFPPSLLPGPGG